MVPLIVIKGPVIYSIPNTELYQNKILCNNLYLIED